MSGEDVHILDVSRARTYGSAPREFAVNEASPAASTTTLNSLIRVSGLVCGRSEDGEPVVSFSVGREGPRTYVVGSPEFTAGLDRWMLSRSRRPLSHSTVDEVCRLLVARISSEEAPAGRLHEPVGPAAPAIRPGQVAKRGLAILGYDPKRPAPAEPEDLDEGPSPPEDPRPFDLARLETVLEATLGSRERVVVRYRDLGAPNDREAAKALEDFQETLYSTYGLLVEPVASAEGGTVVLVSRRSSGP